MFLIMDDFHCRAQRRVYGSSACGESRQGSVRAEVRDCRIYISDALHWGAEITSSSSAPFLTPDICSQ